MMLSVVWGLPFLLAACFVRVHYEGVDDLRRAMDQGRGKPRILLQNHESFLDAILTATMLGCRSSAEVKSMASNHLFKLPVLGTIIRAAGHLAVPFQTQATKAGPEETAGEGDDGSDKQRKGSLADFSTDKAAMARVIDAFANHVKSGNIGAWFPEGRLNPDPEAGLQTFRKGGFTLVTHVDCEIWCLAAKNNHKCWPRKGSVGGYPADIYVKCFKVCDSSFDCLKDEQDKALAMANMCQERMQHELNRLGRPQGALLSAL